MAQLEGIERQWEAKKHSLAEELERVEKLLANAYDRYVCMCEQLMHHMYWSNGRVSHHTRYIPVNTSCAGRWGLPHQLCWEVGTASPAMLGGGDCYPMYQRKQTVIRTVYTCNEGNCTLELRKLVATRPCSTTCDVYDCL